MSNEYDNFEDGFNAGELDKDDLAMIDSIDKENKKEEETAEKSRKILEAIGFEMDDSEKTMILDTLDSYEFVFSSGATLEEYKKIIEGIKFSEADSSLGERILETIDNAIKQREEENTGRNTQEPKFKVESIFDAEILLSLSTKERIIPLFKKNVDKITAMVTNKEEIIEAEKAESIAGKNIEEIKSKIEENVKATNEKYTLGENSKDTEEQDRLLAEINELGEEKGALLLEAEQAESELQDFTRDLENSHDKIMRLLTIELLLTYGLDKNSKKILEKKGLYKQGEELGFTDKDIDNIIKNKNKLSQSGIELAKSELVKTISKLITTKEAASMEKQVDFVLTLSNLKNENKDDLQAAIWANLNKGEKRGKPTQDDIDYVVESYFLKGEEAKKTKALELLKKASPETISEVLANSGTLMAAFPEEEEFNGLVASFIKNPNFNQGHKETLDAVLDVLKRNKEYKSKVELVEVTIIDETTKGGHRQRAFDW